MSHVYEGTGPRIELTRTRLWFLSNVAGNTVAEIGDLTGYASSEVEAMLERWSLWQMSSPTVALSFNRRVLAQVAGALGLPRRQSVEAYTEDFFTWVRYCLEAGSPNWAKVDALAVPDEHTVLPVRRAKATPPSHILETSRSAILPDVTRLRLHAAPPAPMYQLRVILNDVTPAVWRRLVVPGSFTLAELHDVLQFVMGWTNSHLHMFVVGSHRIGMPDPDDEIELEDDTQVRLQSIASKGSSFTYDYDFGDSWHHKIVVENVEPATEDSALQCLAGARACPPEDCGGTGGYENLCEALANPKHPEHAELVTWAPAGFDPERFDLATVNLVLSAYERGRQAGSR